MLTCRLMATPVFTHRRRGPRRPLCMPYRLPSLRRGIFLVLKPSTMHSYGSKREVDDDCTGSLTYLPGRWAGLPFSAKVPDVREPAGQYILFAAWIIVSNLAQYWIDRWSWKLPMYISHVASCRLFVGQLFFRDCHILTENLDIDH